jgi:hypothetical protein
VNDELEKIWKEAVMTYFKVESRHSPGGTKDNAENLSQDSRSCNSFDDWNCIQNSCEKICQGTSSLI